MCNQCHTKPLIDRIYSQAENVLAQTNDRVMQAKAIMDNLHTSGALPSKPFQNPIDFVYFDFWHYDGRTAKHGAFMGDNNGAMYRDMEFSEQPRLGRGVQSGQQTAGARGPGLHGAVTAALPNTARLWEARTSCSGTGTIPCCRRWLS